MVPKRGERPGNGKSLAQRVSSSFEPGAAGRFERMVMSNYYSQAIQVLVNDKTEYRALAFEIAKANPKAVVKAAERLEVGFGWQRECASLMASDLKIAAIKRCRELTGMGLKEAKDACEALV